MEGKKTTLQTRNIYFPDREITPDDLKFVCYMIERTARRIKQPNVYVVEHLSKEGLLHNLSLADVMHCENPDDVVDRWISEYHLKKGSTDVLAVDKTLAPTPPTAIQMGKVYARLNLSVLSSQDNLADKISEVYHSQCLPIKGITKFNHCFPVEEKRRTKVWKKRINRKR